MDKLQGAAAVWAPGVGGFSLLISAEWTTEKSLNNAVIPSFPQESKGLIDFCEEKSLTYDIHRVGAGCVYGSISLVVCFLGIPLGKYLPQYLGLGNR